MVAWSACPSWSRKVETFRHFNLKKKVSPWILMWKDCVWALCGRESWSSWSLYVIVLMQYVHLSLVLWIFEDFRQSIQGSQIQQRCMQVSRLELSALHNAGTNFSSPRYMKETEHPYVYFIFLKLYYCWHKLLGVVLCFFLRKASHLVITGNSAPVASVAL